LAFRVRGRVSVSVWVRVRNVEVAGYHPLGSRIPSAD